MKNYGYIYKLLGFRDTEDLESLDFYALDNGTHVMCMSFNLIVNIVFDFLGLYA